MQRVHPQLHRQRTELVLQESAALLRDHHAATVASLSGSDQAFVQSLASAFDAHRDSWEYKIGSPLIKSGLLLYAHTIAVRLQCVGVGVCVFMCLCVLTVVASDHTLRSHTACAHIECFVAWLRREVEHGDWRLPCIKNWALLPYYVTRYVVSPRLMIVVTALGCDASCGGLYTLCSMCHVY